MKNLCMIAGFFLGSILGLLLWPLCSYWIDRFKWWRFMTGRTTFYSGRDFGDDLDENGDMPVEQVMGLRGLKGEKARQEILASRKSRA